MTIIIFLLVHLIIWMVYYEYLFHCLLDRVCRNQCMYIYDIRTIPVPYHINADMIDETENENTYTHIIPDTEMVAMNRYIY